MSDGSTMADLAPRLRSVRKRRGMTQRELARASGVSLSLISKLEAGVVEGTRLEKVRKLATALRVRTTDLLGTAGDAEEHTKVTSPETWESVRQALLGQFGQPDDEPSVEGVQRGLNELKRVLADNRYGEVAVMLPHLIRDAEAINGPGRTVRARVLNTTGWVLTQTRNFHLAEPTLHQAIDIAADRLDAAAAVNTMVWLYLRQGLLAQARALATEWADDIEPRLSRATTAELTLWGRLLLGVSTTAIRDNRPGEAEDAITLARAAAIRIGHEAISDTSTNRTFGPVTVAMIRAENAIITDEPDKVLAIAERIPMTNLPHAHSVGRNRHRLDVASALVSLRRPNEALIVMTELGDDAPEWLSAQRYARDILARVTERRRTLTPEMRRLADLVGLAY
ncbi:helix-turn-helix domain-containing protein [Nonomuraea longicatena]|uniref:HTH cro/C1-type domain-containing protein n=1 Tax=Nonomuraea longicatena TaxID=83682 RepID=A0ABP4ADQ7_9ACTN